MQLSHGIPRFCTRRTSLTCQHVDIAGTKIMATTGGVLRRKEKRLSASRSCKGTSTYHRVLEITLLLALADPDGYKIVFVDYQVTTRSYRH